MKKIKYSIERHDKLGKDVIGNYVLWKEVTSDHGWGVKGVYQGTRRQCEEEKKRREQNDKITQ